MPVWVSRPLDRPDPPPTAGTVLVLADAAGDVGTGEVLVAGLGASGVDAVLIAGQEHDWATLVDRAGRGRGPVIGLVQVLPRGPVVDPGHLSLASWRHQVGAGAGRLLQVLREPLARSAPTLRSVLALLPCEPGDPDRVVPAQAALRGLLRTLRVEHPTLLVRVVASDATEPGAISGQVLTELWSTSDAGPVDVGYLSGRRVGPAYLPVSRPEATAGPGGRPVLVLTGGAHGITAEVARELARTARPVLVLVGRTPRDRDVETPGTRGEADPRGIRRALALAGDGGTAPGDLERRVRAILARREVEGTLADLQRLGADVDYRVADLADEDAVARLVADVRRRHGGIDGVVHGAGLLADSLLVDKDPATWAAVLAAKADSALLLLRHLDLERLRFLALFSSVAGLFGNRGQVDYAAANTMLDALSVALQDRGPRVVSLIWGPWAGGMATPEVQELFRQRGIGVIERELGARVAVHELLSGGREPQVVLGEGPWVRPCGPLMVDLGDAAPGAARVLDPAQDAFLDDHRIDGAPVLPAAWALEMMVEAARPDVSAGGHVEVEHFQVRHGLRLPAGRAVAHVRPDSGGGARSWLLESGGGRVHFRADIGATADEPVAQAGPELAPATDADRKLAGTCLFHGPSMRAIDRVEALGPGGIRGTVRASGSGLVDPLALDGAFQLAIVWARAVLGATVLPTGFRRLVAGVRSDQLLLVCELALRREASGLLVEGDIVLRDATGPVLRIEGMEWGCSADLNRLGSPVEGAVA